MKTDMKKLNSTTALFLQPQLNKGRKEPLKLAERTNLFVSQTNRIFPHAIKLSLRVNKLL